MSGQIPDWLGDVGEGWHLLLVRAHEKMLKADPNYDVGQLKEKFGGLRIYLDSGFSDATDAIIREAEDVAIRTCEECGRPGSPRTPIGSRYGWIRTLCDTCRADQYRMRKMATREDSME